MIIQDAHVVVGTDWNGIALTITAVGVIIGPIIQWLLSRATRNKLDENTAALAGKQDEIHSLVDGVKSKLEEQNVALKAEVARQNTAGASPTTQQAAGTGDPGSVGIDKGVVTVEDAARNRRADDL